MNCACVHMQLCKRKERGLVMISEIFKNLSIVGLALAKLWALYGSSWVWSILWTVVVGPARVHLRLVKELTKRGREHNLRLQESWTQRDMASRAWLSSRPSATHTPFLLDSCCSFKHRKTARVYDSKTQNKTGTLFITHSIWRGVQSSKGEQDTHR